MAHPHGMFVWAELQVPDPAVVAPYYTTVFGWQIADEGFHNLTCRLAGEPVAGIRSGEPTGWSAYVAVEEAAAVCEDAERLGGEVVHAATEVIGGRQMATVRDPSGAELGLWQAGRRAGSGIFNVPGAMCWNELATRDALKAAAFLAELLPWEMHHEDLGGGLTYTTILLNGSPAGGLYDMGERYPPGLPSHWITYFAVIDTDAAVATAVGLGGSQVMEPMDTPFGRVAGLADPAGGSFRIITLRS